MSRVASGATLTAALLLGFCLVAVVVGLFQ
jgi:hypothetical protein